jgi:rare lipoprotein A (peptidoglycan hydrolase)
MRWNFQCHPSNVGSREFSAALTHTSRNNSVNPATKVFIMKTVLWTLLFLLAINSALADASAATGVASWYGEEHRGRLMANGKRFNPDKLTAASWFYPLGTKVRVTLKSENQAPRSVLVTVTDRGPAKQLVRDGRIIDLTHAAFRRLGHPAVGLVSVVVQPLNY